MGYYITIGEACKSNDSETPDDLYVTAITHPDAPCFPNDFRIRSNTRHPPYSIWDKFCLDTGLTSIFWINQKYYYVNISSGMVDIIRTAIAKWKINHNKLPGFDLSDSVSESPYDANLARLLWLEWWVLHSLNTCRFPIIVVR